MQRAEAFYAPPTPDPATISRAGRVRRAPRILSNFIPTTLAGLPAHIRPPPPAVPTAQPMDVLGSSAEPPPQATPPPVYRTEVNTYGLYREYTTRPQHDPEEEKTLEDFLDPLAFPDAAPSTASSIPSAVQNDATPSDSHTPSLLQAARKPPSASPLASLFPRNNVSEVRLLQWQYTHSTTSNIAVNDLVRNVFQADDFSMSHFPPGFTIEGARARFEEGLSENTNSAFSAKDGWIKTSMKLHVPKEGRRWASEVDAPVFEVPNVLVRSLLDVFVAAFESSAAAAYHWLPHKTFLRPAARQQGTNIDGHTGREPPSLPAGSCEANAQLPTDVRVYTDIYDSDAMIEEDAAMRAQPRQPGDPADLEYAIGAIAVWSDSTHLTNFGTASLWPIYAYSGNQSKYVRACPTTFSAQHLAFIPSVRPLIFDMGHI